MFNKLRECKASYKLKFILLTILGAISIIVVFAFKQFFFGTPIGTYVSIEYRNNNVIIYQCGNVKCTTLPKIYGDLFVSTENEEGFIGIDRVWQISFDHSNDKCLLDDRPKLLSVIIYGIVPNCYTEEVHLIPIEIGTKYYINRSFSTDSRYRHKYRMVYFQLVKCEDGKNCLITNSPRKTNVVSQ